MDTISNSTKEKLLPIEYIAIAALKNKLSYADYKLLAEWLGYYHYIIPSKRELTEGMKHYLVDICEPTVSGLFNAWKLADCIACTLLPAHQRRILLWMSSSI